MHSGQSDAPTAACDVIDAIPVRVRDIATLRGLGYSHREIGTLFGIRSQAVSLMLIRYQRSIEDLGSAVELRGLSARAVNALGRHGIRSREEARRNRALDLLKNERNCGMKTLDEISRWLAQDDLGR
jgi:predicted xylose isomerase-like sugar epimerase